MHNQVSISPFEPFEPCDRFPLRVVQSHPKPQCSVHGCCVGAGGEAEDRGYQDKMQIDYWVAESRGMWDGRGCGNWMAKDCRCQDEMADELDCLMAESRGVRDGCGRGNGVADKSSSWNREPATNWHSYIFQSNEESNNMKKGKSYSLSLVSMAANDSHIGDIYGDSTFQPDTDRKKSWLHSQNLPQKNVPTPSITVEGEAIPFDSIPCSSTSSERDLSCKQAQVQDSSPLSESCSSWSPDDDTDWVNDDSDGEGSQTPNAMKIQYKARVQASIMIQERVLRPGRIQVQAQRQTYLQSPRIQKVAKAVNKARTGSGGAKVMTRIMKKTRAEIPRDPGISRRVLAYKMTQESLLARIENMTLKIARVKGHLYRHHRIFQCQRCKRLFSNQQEVNDHLKQQEACELLKDVQEDGITNEMVERLRSKKKTHRSQSEEDRWKEMYRIIFPTEAVPDPFFEEIQEDFVQSLDFQQLADYEEYCRRELPRAVRVALEETINSLEEQLRSQLVEIIRDAQERVFAKYRSFSTLTVANDASKSSPHSGSYQGVSPTSSSQIAAAGSHSTKQIGETTALFFEPPPPQIGLNSNLDILNRDMGASEPGKNDLSDSVYDDSTPAPPLLISNSITNTSASRSEKLLLWDNQGETKKAENGAAHMYPEFDVSRGVIKTGNQLDSPPPQTGLEDFDIDNEDFPNFDLSYLGSMEYLPLENL
ncbi:hypothetical protein NHQ30_009968 [Ciborinia camelliae]|nr:hypothetical protein NHQ30_009968 [Ciborinia camelliae]